MSNNEKTASATKHTRKHGGTPNTLHITNPKDNTDGKVHALCGEVWTQTTAEKFDDITGNHKGYIRCGACDLAHYAMLYEAAREHFGDSPHLDRVTRDAMKIRERRMGMDI
ncbi:hypothetical protein [Bifidobacterium cuniculi]|uniref:Uncharacterized protein n=1 Tax=Bifidobacterium cuniculi TaxID=1688 RepID=A0A087AHS3_9BIFI|nr:hypothetical protein [Bifidobacterium cuniculi]KFI58323.1 hypothetical protein BCUN_1924 [Bifidobacterium cuniculi]